MTEIVSLSQRREVDRAPLKVQIHIKTKVQKLIAELEAAMTHIMALLAAQYKRANYRASARRETGESD